MVYVLFFCAWSPGSWHIGTCFLGAWPWVAWPLGTWHSSTVTFFCFLCLAQGGRQPPDSSGTFSRRGNTLLLSQFSFNPKQNPGVFFHFLVLFCVLLMVLLLVLSLHCLAFPGAFIQLNLNKHLATFLALLIVLLLVFFCLGVWPGWAKQQIPNWPSPPPLPPPPPCLARQQAAGTHELQDRHFENSASLITTSCSPEPNL